MRAKRVTPAELLAAGPGELLGAILLAPVQLDGGRLPKGTRLDAAAIEKLATAASAGTLQRGVPLAWPGPDDLHEDEAAQRLARAVGGEGVTARTPRQSRLDLVARWDGVVHVKVPELTRLNALDPLEVFTVFHGQAVVAGETVASVKVAPHVIARGLVEMGERLAGQTAPLVDVRPYLPLEVGAIAEETLTNSALTRFEEVARRKVEALGSRFAGTLVVGDPDPAAAERDSRTALEQTVRKRRLPVVLVGGVSAGDPLSPFLAALESLGGRVLRRGVPAHPGSMIWLAELDDSRLLGLPQCGMFTMATAADLVLPRLLTGERLTAAELADLGHGGVLGPEMRFRFPAYARDLRAPEG